ncbi:phosphatase PAP2 family protein [Vibrio astriarenae]|uniref:phosphatase PAP2 family protein n=1 Tax=Vibrio astriarenae TaxID=1481923 RepID=UPI003735840E
MRVMNPIARFDLAFSLFCLQHRFNHQVALMSRAVSHTGDGHLYVVIALVAYLMDTDTGKVFVLCGLSAFLIELPIYWALKNSFKRRRPPELSSQLISFITPSDRYSLPSGHTAAGFLMATIISQFYPQLTPIAFGWAGLIGLSRILLGVHFITDVVIGVVLGIGCAELAISLVGV